MQCNHILIILMSCILQSADKNLISDAMRASEESHLEKAMLEDKMRETDWELTQESMEEQVARESYLQWLRDNEKRNTRPNLVRI